MRRCPVGSPAPVPDIIISHVLSPYVSSTYMIALPVRTHPRWFSGSLSITGYRLGEGLVEHMDRVAAPRKMVGTIVFSKKPPYRAFTAADDHEDLRRQTVPLLRLRPSSKLHGF
jgi:hypothetical protein